MTSVHALPSQHPCGDDDARTDPSRSGSQWSRTPRCPVRAAPTLNADDPSRWARAVRGSPAKSVRRSSGGREGDSGRQQHLVSRMEGRPGIRPRVLLEPAQPLPTQYLHYSWASRATADTMSGGRHLIDRAHRPLTAASSIRGAGAASEGRSAVHPHETSGDAIADRTCSPRCWPTPSKWGPSTRNGQYFPAQRHGPRPRRAANEPGRGGEEVSDSNSAAVIGGLFAVLAAVVAGVFGLIKVTSDDDGGGSGGGPVLTQGPTVAPPPVTPLPIGDTAIFSV